MTGHAGLSLGVLARSRKPDERRLPIHPAHFARIDPELRKRIFVEKGYGAEFGTTDDALTEFVGGVKTRDEIVAACDVILLPKVQAEDLAQLRAGQIIWGWPHCVQDIELTQIAIDRKQTLIAFEAMNHWQADGGFGLHVFHKNNELAGYCSVLHAMQLAGVTGSYGRRMRAAVIGFGATARGAVTALNAHGVDDVRVLTNREVAAVGSPIPSTQMVQMAQDEDGQTWADIPEYGSVPVARLLADNDIVVNCVLQDPNSPLVFLTTEDLETFTPGTMLIDVSCDVGMGFSWARPTTFKNPVVDLAHGVSYYAVDHSPSYLWNSATWEISEALLPHLATVLGGRTAWDESTTISRAIEIRDGTVQNPAILAFQHRAATYPHPVSG
ncbi:N(5)-(carboxyethyl)ornithine synthase [Mycolicibacterium diernhoferi]|uniref:Alanine dehydrogenase n=1 Tax=Mycolicibacterium diernhoferi TaxID=1801 RepID=A0A1Q4HMI0_9MYCO|nr:alanine dehydrogenase [Mycolicibacterium diernhoferi]OPE48650.1 alanine dehydrogenase [Mycolicibacterium diernhoferi]PEG54522.1 alanine dehydrogenase [Mycolicibacterium diernhoferi]QYL25664.1 N(5)-(carboxyethyl)ornithine synthase [Mycolicibacterium diernhoferi]